MTSRNRTRLQHRETATMCTRVRLVESRFGRNGCASRRWDRLGMQALCNWRGKVVVVVPCWALLVSRLALTHAHARTTIRHRNGAATITGHQAHH